MRTLDQGSIWSQQHCSNKKWITLPLVALLLLLADSSVPLEIIKACSLSELFINKEKK